MSAPDRGGQLKYEGEYGRRSDYIENSISSNHHYEIKTIILINEDIKKKINSDIPPLRCLHSAHAFTRQQQFNNT